MVTKKPKSRPYTLKEMQDEFFEDIFRSLQQVAYDEKVPMEKLEKAVFMYLLK